MHSPNNHPLLLADVIKQRRITLGRTQQQLAEQLRVAAETICYWEAQKRRIALDRVPRLAAALQLDAQDLSRLALFEYHPRLHAALFGSEPPQPRPVSPSSAAAARAFETIVVVGGRLRERE
jgi:transcriptional regulator with XRE-family HTH domain